MTTSRTFERNMPDGSLIVATASVDGGYFSLTGEVYEPHGTWSGEAQRRNGREWDRGGMVHEDILRAFPQLASFARLHLSDVESGEPMHAEANGWYWYSSYDGQGTHIHESRRGEMGSDLEICARHLRVDVADIPEGLDREGFSAFVDGLREQWRADTEAAREILAAK